MEFSIKLFEGVFKFPHTSEGLTGQQILRILYSCDKEKLEAAVVLHPLLVFS